MAGRIAEATRGLQAERVALAAILDGLAEGVVVATLDGRITLANAVAQELLVAAGPLVGDSLFDLVDPSLIARSWISSATAAGRDALPSRRRRVSASMSA